MWMCRAYPHTFFISFLFFELLCEFHLFVFGLKCAVRFFAAENNKLKVMKKYRCEVCDYIYDPELGDPEAGVKPGTAFEDLPEDWVCPLCGVGKDEFVPVD